MPSLAEVTHALPCAGGLDGEVAGALGGALEGMPEAGAVEAGAVEAGALGAVAGEVLDDGLEVGCGCAADAGLAWAVHRTTTDLVGHFGAVIEMWLSFPPARQP